jgi:hypothetical protein
MHHYIIPPPTRVPHHPIFQRVIVGIVFHDESVPSGCIIGVWGWPDPRNIQVLREGQGPIVEGTRPLFPDPEELHVLETRERIRDDRVVLVIVGVIQVLKL